MPQCQRLAISSTELIQSFTLLLVNRADYTHGSYTYTVSCRKKSLLSVGDLLMTVVQVSRSI